MNTQATAANTPRAPIASPLSALSPSTLDDSGKRSEEHTSELQSR